MRSWAFVLLLVVSAESSKPLDVFVCKPFESDYSNETEKQRRVIKCEEQGFEEAEEFPASLLLPITHRISNGHCRRQIYTFLRALQNSSSWAIEMLDASAKIPLGLLAANTYQFGNYELCVGINEPSESIRGQYCLAEVQFAPTQKKYPEFLKTDTENEFSLKYDPYKSAWEKFKVTKDPSKKRRDIFYSGICVPDGCPIQDVQMILNQLSEVLASSYELKVNISVSELSCTTNGRREIRTGGIVLGSIMATFVIAVFICTAWDSITDAAKNNMNRLQAMMKSFSITRNISKLLAPDPDIEMDVFHGMKTLSMVLIIMGHRCMSSYGGPLFNPQFVEERYRKFQDMLLMNGTLIVDTFFLIGGYITFMTLYNAWESKKKPKALDVYLYRWLRLTPVYLLVVFFYGYLLEYVGSGPLWALRAGREAERCRKNWWTNFLYINNYVNSEQLCMFQSWYVTCDMHYILLTPLLVKLIFHTTKKGLAVLGAIILGSVIVPFVVTYYNEYDGVLRVYMSIFEDLATSFTFTKVYIKTHNRATPYFFGLAAGYIYLRLKKSGFVFSQVQTWIFSLLAAFFSLSAIFGAWFFYVPGRPYDALENALYASLHRVFWALSMAWIPIGGGRRAFGVIQPVLSGKVYIPFSRLSYGAFLLHGTIQMYTTTTLRSPEYMSYFKLFWMTSSDIILSFLFAFVLHLFFEAPMKGIHMSLLMPHKYDKSTKEDCKSEKHQREQGEEKTNSEIRKSLRKKTKQKKQSSFPKEDNKQKCQ